MSRAVLVTILSAAAAGRGQPASWPVRVGSAEVRPGAVTRGTIPLLEYADSSTVGAPVIVVAGREPGPVAWFIACGHGDEFGGALAIQRIARSLDPEQVDVVEEYRIVTPARGGFFHALAKPGDRLRQGTPLGRVVNVYGDEVEVLSSPVGNAILLGIQDYPAVASGAWVAELGILAEP